uniref:Translin-associated factor X-interacting protein 1 N-terminal domain-containing protein n=1 Tax=Astyanax mexicanus TaxID=7994 RepID=W5LLY0_ASTMX
MDVKGKTELLFRTAADREFLESLQQFTCGEKECLSGPEHRYNIYKAAFDKVIDHATLYKMLLTSIKKEYDDFIAAVKTNNQRSKLAHKKLKAMETQPTSLMNFQRRAGLLYLFLYLGLTFSESLNPEALDKRLLFLKQKRDNLLSKIKSQYIPRQEKDALDFKMRTSLNQRDALILENNRLQRRFSDLFNSGEYEAAAYHAAKSPHGVLRNMETMMRFKSVSVYERQLPPVLLFFQALMLSAQPGKQVPGERMSLEGVRCALQYNYIQLATFGVTQQRLSYSEELGDMICNHGDKDPRIADTCLALAQIIFTACGAVKKAVLSMCRRGLTSGALEHIYKNRDFTVEDLIFVLRECPSLSLLEDLTQPYGGNPALLSVGFICHYLLSAGLEDLAFQLLEKIYTDGQGALQQTILDDVMCSAEGWSEIAARCVQRERPQLAQGIISTLLSQPGAMCLPQEQESAKLMEHVFM